MYRPELTEFFVPVGRAACAQFGEMPLRIISLPTTLLAGSLEAHQEPGPREPDLLPVHLWPRNEPLCPGKCYEKYPYILYLVKPKVYFFHVLKTGIGMSLNNNIIESIVYQSYFFFGGT